MLILKGISEHQFAIEFQIMKDDSMKKSVDFMLYVKKMKNTEVSTKCFFASHALPSYRESG